MNEKYQQNYTQGVFIWMVCNAKCIFCNTQKGTTTLKKYYEFYSFDRIKKDILEKIEKGATCIIYEWWDFTIHPDVFKILDFWKSLWLIQTMQTNWIKLANPDFVKRFKEQGINEINFSIHAFEEKVSEKIMWLKWSFKKTLKWALNCNKEWINISNNFVLVKDNLNQLEWIIFLMLKLNIKLFNITLYIPIDRFDDNFHNRFLVDPVLAWKKISWMLNIYSKIKELSKWELVLNFKFHNIWRCILDKNIQKINFELDLDRRKENKKDYQFDTWFYKKEDCKKCIYNNNCTGFTEKYVKVFWDDYIKPILF